MRLIYFLFLIFFLNSCSANISTATNNVKYQKAKSECIWKGYYKKKDKFKECVKEKMSR